MFICFFLWSFRLFWSCTPDNCLSIRVHFFRITAWITVTSTTLRSPLILSTKQGTGGYQLGCFWFCCGRESNLVYYRPTHFIWCVLINTQNVYVERLWNDAHVWNDAHENQVVRGHNLHFSCGKCGENMQKNRIFNLCSRNSDQSQLRQCFPTFICPQPTIIAIFCLCEPLRDYDQTNKK